MSHFFSKIIEIVSILNTRFSYIDLLILIFLFLQKASRGVPDGKSDEIVTSEIVEGDVVKYNLQENKKVAYQPHTQRG